MCGICGIIDFRSPVERETIERMTAVLFHRGPDDSGIEMDGPAALGFRRLSIIDLGGSHQPMSNEDETIWVVFNGEIYNYQPLRDQLQKKGHRFKTAGDTETILHLYEDHGLDFVQHLIGMFAIAIWDGRRQRLVLARDRLGIKPLYYRLTGDSIAFASETKSILEADRGPTTLDAAAIADYMNYSSISGERTCFREVRRLLPGYLATFDRSGFSTQLYWDINNRPQLQWKQNDLLEAVEALLRDSVRLRMISDVPLGLFLSGGVDSSLVGALMAEFSSKPVEAFSIGYGAEGAYMNEMEYSKAVADRYGMNHRTLILCSQDLLRDMDKVTWYLDEPCGDPAAFLTLALSRFTRQHVTVSLSGIGGDELFSGYQRHRAILWQHRYMKLPRFVRDGVLRPLIGLFKEGRTSIMQDRVRMLRKFIYSMDGDARTCWAHMTSYLPEYDGPIFSGEMAAATRESYASEAFEHYWARTSGMPTAVDRVMYMDIKMYLADQLLMLQDKMSMAVSLESREPMLDYRLAELMATVPVKQKLAGGELKAVLKKLAEKYVPRQCIYRPKKGFAAPVEVWLRGPLREQVDEALSPTRVRDRGIFDLKFIEWLKREFYEGGRDLTVQVYQAFMLETWMRMWVDGRGRPQPNQQRNYAQPIHSLS